jgi:hypothetical protein
MKMLVVGLLLVSTPAFADDYGWKVASTDAAGLALTLGSLHVGGGQAEDAMAFFGVTTMIVGGPVVHAVNGGGWKVAKSLGLRIGLTMVGAMLGPVMWGDNDCGLNLDACFEPIVLGAEIGGLTAMALDATLLANTPAERPPGLVVAPGAGSLTIAGTF